VPEIDAEHRTLFRLAEEFHETLRKEPDAARLQLVLHSLIGALEDHFSHEERLMRDTDYPAFEWHKQQHDGVRRRVRQFAAAIDAGDSEAPLLLVDYVAGWLKDHTRLTDRMLGAHLRNYGRQQAVAS
jgi:hemerythrin-like metal-binding protein